MPPKAPKVAKPPTKKLLKDVFQAIRDEDLGVIKAALAKGFDPSATFNAAGVGDQPALNYALYMEKHASARLLLEAGANVTATSTRGDTALHHVKDLALAKELLERGAQVAPTNQYGWTPLHEQSRAGRHEIVELLLEKGARIDAATIDGKTPYSLSSDPKTRAVLKRHGAKGFGPGGGKVLSPLVSAATFSMIDVERGTIGIDRSGAVWFAGYKGVVRFDGTALTHYKFEETFTIGGIAAGPGGVVYFATTGGLVRFSKDVFTLYSSDTSELFENRMVHIAASPAGEVYFTLHERGEAVRHICAFDGATFRVLTPGVDFPPNLEISCLAFDGAGKLVIGCESGIAVQREGTWTVIQALDPASPFASRVYDMAASGDVLWIGSQEGVYEYRNGTFTLHKTDKLVKCLCVDGDEVWLGMYYGGLGRLRAGELAVFQPAGTLLPHEDVEDILRGTDGRIWIHAGGKVAFIREGEIELLPS